MAWFLSKKNDRLGFVLLSLFLVTGFFPNVAMADKRADLVSMQGVTYSPTPTDYTGSGAGVYYDSDFCNDDFQALWGKDNSGIGREDVKNIAQNIGALYVRLYDWNVPQGRNHKPFLNECNKYGLKVLVPISNYFIGLYDQGQTSQADGFIKDIIGELVSGGKFNPAVAMITVGNEPELSGKSTGAVVKAIEAVLKAQEQLGVADADMLPVCVPEDFGTYGEPTKPGVVRLRTVRDAIQGSTFLTSKKFLETLYVAAMQTSNPGSDITTWLNATFPAAFPDDYVVFTELGRDDITCGGLQEQANFDKAAWDAVIGSTNKKTLGAFIFSYENQNWKRGAEAAYGMNTKAQSSTIAYTKSGQQYRVDTLTPKPVYNAIHDIWKGFASADIHIESPSSPGAFFQTQGGASSYKVYVTVHEMSAAGRNAEWYLFHITPTAGIYQLQLDWTWLPVDKITSLGSAPISTFQNALIFEGELAKGTHLFIFAIDPLVNGNKDTKHWETEVEIIEVQ